MASRFLITGLLPASFALQQSIHEPGVGALPRASTSLSASEPFYLNITALTSSPTPHYHPQLTCLRLPTPFNTYPTTGSSVPLSLPLSSARNMTLVTLPPHGSEGWHNPPMPMWFVLLRGKAVVTTYDPGEETFNDKPISSAETRDRTEHDIRQQQRLVDSHPSHVSEKRQKVTIEVGSPNQFLLALDLLGRGHWTEYPSDEETWALQIPLAEGWQDRISKWDVIGEGPCI